MQTGRCGSGPTTQAEYIHSLFCYEEGLVGLVEVIMKLYITSVRRLFINCVQMRTQQALHTSTYLQRVDLYFQDARSFVKLNTVKKLVHESQWYMSTCIESNRVSLELLLLLVLRTRKLYWSRQVSIHHQQIAKACMIKQAQCWAWSWAVNTWRLRTRQWSRANAFEI